VLYLHHSVNCEVYINGVNIGDIGIYSSGYNIIDINDAAANALKANGKNVIAIHCKQNGGIQYMDAGIAILTTDKKKSTY